MDKMIDFKQKNRLTYGRGYVYSIQYHVVWVTKYRKPVLIGDVEKDIKQFLLDTLKSIHMEAVELEVMPDHIHLLLNCKPQCCISDAIKILKGNTARWLFLKYPELKSTLRGGHLWNPSYFVSTVGATNKEQIANYIRSQKEQ